MEIDTITAWPGQLEWKGLMIADAGEDVASLNSHPLLRESEVICDTITLGNQNYL